MISEQPAPSLFDNFAHLCTEPCSRGKRRSKSVSITQYRRTFLFFPFSLSLAFGASPLSWLFSLLWPPWFLPVGLHRAAFGRRSSFAKFGSRAYYFAQTFCVPFFRILAFGTSPGWHHDCNSKNPIFPPRHGNLFGWRHKNRPIAEFFSRLAVSFAARACPHDLHDPTVCPLVATPSPLLCKVGLGATVSKAFYLSTASSFLSPSSSQRRR